MNIIRSSKTLLFLLMIIVAGVVFQYLLATSSHRQTVDKRIPDHMNTQRTSLPSVKHEKVSKTASEHDKDKEQENTKSKGLDNTKIENMDKTKTKEQQNAKTENSDKTKTNKLDNTKTKKSLMGTTPMTKPKKRYLIYLCDNTNYCYGLGDRQRAVASMYVLAVVNNRTFGVSWKYPCPLEILMEPGNVNWTIPESELKGKSTIVLELLSPKTSIDFETPLNRLYTEDVIYMRTNHYFLPGLQNSKYYHDRLPKWAQQYSGKVFSKVWTEIMIPRPLVRNSLNDMLIRIAQRKKIDAKAMKHLLKIESCAKSCDSLMKNSNLTSTMNSSMAMCVQELGKKMSSEGFTDYRTVIAPENIPLMCRTKMENESSIMDIETIRKSKGYDVVNINLVCLHIRIGRSNELPTDPARNTLTSTSGAWEFIRPYVERGRHVYLAADHSQVRADGRKLFGHRLYSSTAPIVHIASVKEGQNEIEGMRFAMWEQLMLMTSCETLVISKSGFSMWATIIRKKLMGGKNTFMFDKGQVTKY